MLGLTTLVAVSVLESDPGVRVRSPEAVLDTVGVLDKLEVRVNVLETVLLLEIVIDPLDRVRDAEWIVDAVDVCVT